MATPASIPAARCAVPVPARRRASSSSRRRLPRARVVAHDAHDASDAHGADRSPRGIEAEATLRLHYHRADGDAAAFGVHAWDGARSPTRWEAPVRPVAYARDGGAMVEGYVSRCTFEVPLADGASSISFIVHRGDEKCVGVEAFDVSAVAATGGVCDAWVVAGAGVVHAEAAPAEDAADDGDREFETFSNVDDASAFSRPGPAAAASANDAPRAEADDDWCLARDLYGDCYAYADAASDETPTPTSASEEFAAPPPPPPPPTPPKEEEQEEETLEAFATRVCARIGRGGDDARVIATKLRANWIERAADVRALPAASLAAIGVPAAFAMAMHAMTLEEEGADSEGAEEGAEERDADGGVASNVVSAGGSYEHFVSPGRQRARRDDDDDGPASSAFDGDATAAAATSNDGWIGGALPGPDARLPGPTTGRGARDRRVRGGAGVGGLALSDIRVTKRKRLPPYSLRPRETPAALQAEFDALRRDVTGLRVGGGRDPVRGTTADNYEQVARGLMGWYVKVKLGGWDGVTPLPAIRARDAASGALTHRDGVPPPASDALSFRDVLTSADADGARLAIEYMQWLCASRKIQPKTEDFQLRSLVALAKWLWGGGDGVDASPVVAELVRVQRGARARGDKAPHAADETKKWLDWPEYLQLVETLKRECAPLTWKGARRSKKDVAAAVQRYLLFAILACVPDRQRTLRELELDRTLFREVVDVEVDVVDPFDAGARTGRTEWVSRATWVVRHSPEDYKTGGAYGARPDLVLDPRLYPALEAWLFDAGVDDAADAEDGVGQSVGQKVRTTSDGYGVAGYRAALRPKHSRVFSRPNGEPWDVSELSRAFSRAAVRLTGKKTNPHLVRDMVITHVRGEGIASDAELEALSLYMGHSIAMQKGTYDRRTSAQKVAPAIGLMSAINARAAGGVGGGSGGEKKR